MEIRFCMPFFSSSYKIPTLPAMPLLNNPFPNHCVHHIQSIVKIVLNHIMRNGLCEKWITVRLRSLLLQDKDKFAHFLSTWANIESCIWPIKRKMKKKHGNTARLLRQFVSDLFSYVNIESRLELEALY